MHSFGQPVIDELASADNYVNYCKGLCKSIYKASLFKKYYLYCETIWNYPQLLDFYPDLYREVFYYLKDNMYQILIDFKIPVHIKIHIIKRVFAIQETYEKKSNIS